MIAKSKAPARATNAAEAIAKKLTERENPTTISAALKNNFCPSGGWPQTIDAILAKALAYCLLDLDYSHEISQARQLALLADRPERGGRGE